MLKVLLIDDEFIIREGLKSIIDWQSCGFEICGEAENGLEGLEKIRDCRPDLVIVDIKMPVMDGLQMVEQSRNRGDSCSFIILTAYSEFSYAQKSIELDIDSYILKPIEQSDLKEKVGKVYSSILARNEAQCCMDNSISLSRCKILEDIVNGIIPDRLYDTYTKLYNLDFPWKSYTVALVDTGLDKSGGPSLKNNLKEEIESFLKQNNPGYVLDLGKATGILLKNASSVSLPRLLANLRDRLDKAGGRSAAISVGSPVDSLDKVSRSYKQAGILMENKFLYGHKGIIIGGTDEEPEYKGSVTESRFDFDILMDKLYRAVDANNASVVNDILEDIRARFLKLKYSEDVIKMNYTTLYLTVLNRLSSIAVEFRRCGSQKGEVLREICRKGSLQELHGYIKYVLLSIAEEVDSIRPAGSINRILDYIGRNYHTDIKLENLASLFNYNSTYLGKLFKSQTGQSFNTYLDRLRIEKAKELLKQGMKVYQVAELTGIRDIDYFYRKFKKYTGLSPSCFKSAE